MSDGKKLVAAILASGSVETLRKIRQDVLLEDEVEAFQYVSQHYRRYHELPTVQTVEQETRIRLPRALESVDYYTKKVYDRQVFQFLREDFTELKGALQSMDVDRAKEIVAAMHSHTRTGNASEDLRNLAQASQMVLRRYEDAHHRPGVTGIPSGYGRMDEATGGYQPGDLVSYIGRMATGKTYTLLKQAHYAWQQGYSVMLVTTEMTIEQMVRRTLALATRIQPDAIRKGMLCNYGYRRLQRYVDSMVGTDRFNIYAAAFGGRTTDIEILMHELTPDIVFVDGAYLLKPPESKRSMTRLERVPEVIDSLKQIALSSARPIIASSQFSRGAGKKGKDGSMETIAYSDAIGTHSSIVVAIKEGRPPYQKTRRVLEIMKGREGEEGEYEIYYDFDNMNFDEVPVLLDADGNPIDEQGNRLMPEGQEGIEDEWVSGGR